MCGIAGFELRDDSDEVAARLLSRLANRGPDGGWFTRAEPYGLVQTRLAVIDLSDRVKYPLRNESGDLLLLFNGEIYEHGRHRAELQRKGHRFSTECDAEVVLHGYEEWGVELFRRLDGMFAAALLHVPSGELVLVRDALGIKPLVYTTEKRFAFSSDSFALVAAGLSQGEVDEPLLGEYLAFHYFLPPATGLCDVRQLGPGELLRRSARGDSSIERWRPRAFSRGAGAAVGLAEAEAALDRSVCRQLVADVPVGVFLSSGLDSSLVLDSAVRAGARPTAFTLSFAGQRDYDEAPAAGRFARRLGIPHVTGRLSGGFAETVDLVCETFDQPLGDASAIATTQLARLARAAVTVTLTGTGGDDLYAGYYRHRMHRLPRVIGRSSAALLRPLAALAPEHGSERRSLAALASSYLARLAAVGRAEPFLQYLELSGSTSSDAAVALTPAAAASIADLEAAAHRVGATREASGSLLRTIQAFELATYLIADLLAKEDRATMAVGLEARVPLLGIEMLELAERAPDEQKLGLLSGKRLLREIARRRLPGHVTRVRKRGFAVPLAYLFAGPWRQEAVEWFADSSSSLVDGPMASRLLREGRLPPTDAWALAVLSGWEQSLRRGPAHQEAGRRGNGIPAFASRQRPHRITSASRSDDAAVRVRAVTAYPEITAGARVRVVEMGRHLRPHDVHVDFRPTITTREYQQIAQPGVSARKALVLARAFARSAAGTDAVDGSLTLVHRLRSLTPAPHDDDPVDVYDFDDAIYLASPLSSNRRFSALKREAARSVGYMGRARLVFAGNRVLADTARQHARRVEIVPSCVDPSLQRRREHADADVLTLGWIGSRSTSQYLRPVLEVIRSLHDSGRSLRLLLLGAAPTLHASWIEHRAWSLEAEREMLTEVDIGLMPLPDDPWARGKCGYKLLRYFSAGLPAIASPVGVNADLIRGGGAFSATIPQEWRRAIEELASDASVRQQIGDQSRSFVEREYSFQVWAPRVAALLREASSG